MKTTRSQNWASALAIDLSAPLSSAQETVQTCIGRKSNYEFGVTSSHAAVLCAYRRIEISHTPEKSHSVPLARAVIGLLLTLVRIPGFVWADDFGIPDKV